MSNPRPLWELVERLRRLDDGHTMGSHSDVPQDTEPCYCDRERRYAYRESADWLAAALRAWDEALKQWIDSCDCYQEAFPNDTIGHHYHRGGLEAFQRVSEHILGVPAKEPAQKA